MPVPVFPAQRFPVQRAADVMRHGGVIAYPTEAVWGLGCDPHHPEAVARILQLKRRPGFKGLIVVTGSLCDIEHLLNPLPPERQQQIRATWPGPVTWILPDTHQTFPASVRGKHDGVAVRVTAHPLVAALCHAFGGPIVSTSCNRAGRPPLRSAHAVRRQFGAELDDILIGQLGTLSAPTQIFDALTGRRLR